MKTTSPHFPFTEQRRRVLQVAGALAMANATPLTFAQATGRKIKIGYVTPQTGPLAGFGEVDSFVWRLFVHWRYGV